MAYKTGNPALNKDTFSKLQAVASASSTMTLEGVSIKSIILLIVAITTGAFGWNFAVQNPDQALGYALMAIIAALVIAIITVIKKTASPVTAPIYAVLEGFALGVISQFYEAEFGGIVLQALLLTAAIFLAMLAIYYFRIIRATENFKLGVAAATGGVMLFYLASIGLSFFGITLPLIHENTPFGIIFTVAVIILAALNLVCDFDFIEQGVRSKAPKYMEWYASFGLFVTIVWLYLELLRLLAKLRSR